MKEGPKRQSGGSKDGITMVVYMARRRLIAQTTPFSRTQGAQLGTMKSGRPHLQRHAEVLENTSST